MHPIWTQKSTNPGASDAAIAAWNTQNEKQLPAVLTALLRQHDGGMLRQFHSRWDLLPLADIKPVDTAYLESEWQMQESMEEWGEELENSDIPPDTVLYPFVRDGNHFYWLAWLDGAEEPVVISRHWDDFDFHVGKSPVDDWCVRNLAPVPSALPGVAWEETRVLEVIFEEKCLKCGWIQLDQVLGRKDGRLWLYTHELWERGGKWERESYSKCLLPEPFDPNECEIRTSSGNAALSLKPADSKECVEYQSRRNEESGGWQEDSTTDYRNAEVESLDRGKIEALRAQLFGAKAAAKADQKAHRKNQIWGAHNAMADKLQASLLEVCQMAEDDPARQGMLEAVQKQMMEALAGTSTTMERCVMRLIPPFGEAADLLAAIQQYCREHGIAEPPGLTTRTAHSHAVFRRDQGAPGLVAVTWKTLEEAAAYLKKNPPAYSGEAVEILDFAKRNRYGWSPEGPVLSGDF